MFLDLPQHSVGIEKDSNDFDRDDVMQSRCNDAKGDTSVVTPAALQSKIQDLA